MNDNAMLIEQIRKAADPQEMLAAVRAAGYNNFNTPPQDVRDAEQDKWDEWWSVNQFALDGMTFTPEQQFRGLVRNARTKEHCHKISKAFGPWLRALAGSRKSEMILLLSTRLRAIQAAEREGRRFDIATE